MKPRGSRGSISEGPIGIGGGIIRRPVRRAWVSGCVLCLLTLIPGISNFFVTGILLGITFSIIDLFLMWNGLKKAVQLRGGKAPVIGHYLTRYLLLGVFLALVRFVSFPAFWGAVSGCVLTRGFLVAEGFVSHKGQE